MTATKIQPGDDTHLTLLMAPHSLNFVTGADRAALLAYGRDVFAAARDSKCLAQIEEPAGAAPAAVAPQGERQWICPTRTVADLVNNLLTMDQALPIYGAQYIEKDGRRCAIAVPPTVSRERVKDGRWIGQGEELNAAVVWTRAEQPVATPGLTDGQLDDESYRVNDEPGFADAFRAGARFAERVHGVTASAARAVTGKADWWRGRADEIEVRVARSGSQEAMRCYTDMRTLLQAAAPALEAPAAPAAPMPWTNARQPHDPKIQDGYMESDLAWCRRNRDAVTWLIDNQAEIRAALAGVPQAPAAPILGDAERLAAARQDKSLADYWRNRVAGLAEEFTTAEAALYLADRIVADLYDLPQAGVARPAAPAAPVLGRSVAEALKDLQEMWDDMAKSSSGPSHERTMRRFGDALSTIERTVAAPAAPAVDAEMSEDAERFRAMANAALTDDEVFGRALDQHPDMGGDATIDDVRAMFDAARAAQAKEGGGQ
jgi:hypothetical protein